MIAWFVKASGDGLVAFSRIVQSLVCGQDEWVYGVATTDWQGGLDYKGIHRSSSQRPLLLLTTGSSTPLLLAWFPLNATGRIDSIEVITAAGAGLYLIPWM